VESIKRLSKYQIAAEATLKDLNLAPIVPARPQYLYHLQDAVVRVEYEKGHSIPEIMPLNSVGLVTSRDRLAIAFTEDEMEKRVADFARRDTEDARHYYKLGKDVRDWRVAWAQEDVKTGGRVIPVHYRPFDRRFTFYTGRSRGFHVYPRDTVSKQLLRPNIALVTSRLTKGEDFRHVQVTDKPTEVICMPPITSNNGFVFPLRGEGDVENFSANFRSFLDARYEHHFTPEEIFGYIYAVLHAPTYRTRYAEFLRNDFPRVPFPELADEFETLSGLGWALVQAHLLNELPRRALAVYHGKGDHLVEAVQYSTEAVAINNNQFFKPVPPAVWEFHIGGYQVLDKYLKSRKGRILSLDEINHVAAIADSLAFTVDQMVKIDKAYTAAFPNRG